MGDRSFKVDLNWHTQSHDCYWSPTPQVSEGLFTTRGFDTLSFEKVMEEIMKLEYSGATASSQAHRLAAHPSVNARDLSSHGKYRHACQVRPLRSGTVLIFGRFRFQGQNGNSGQAAVRASQQVQDKYGLGFVPMKCPSCNNDRIRRSRRHGIVESWILAMILVRPFRCRRCGERFFAWSFRANPNAPRPARNGVNEPAMHKVGSK
jgi:predicted Zn-ribbon and HTH transcriptional regulator